MRKVRVKMTKERAKVMAKMAKVTLAKVLSPRIRICNCRSPNLVNGLANVCALAKSRMFKKIRIHRIRPTKCQKVVR